MNNAIQILAKTAQKRAICTLFKNANRATDFSVAAAGLYLDYAKQNVTTNELSQLVSWAQQVKLPDNIGAMFSGKKINNTENRAVLHTVLRASASEQYTILGDDIAKEVIDTNQRFVDIVESVIDGRLLGITGKRFTDVLAIGIGGSFYGVKVGLSALKPYNNTGLNVHVLANIDGTAVEEKLAILSPETTLVVVISKTFTTQETRLNAETIKSWMLNASDHNNNIITKQWFAISTNIVKATEFGIKESNILPMWDWVGGRFSIWSAVGLPLALAIGMENFNAFKAGAKQMDEHFKNAPLLNNMPVLMALIGIWNRNFLAHPTLAILPYNHALRALPGYLQQTDMESNGKSVSVKGKMLAWNTAPVVFGQEGTNGQHAFMQLMHQSDDIIPIDFIVALQGSSNLKHHHRVLVANCIAQSEALMQGKSLAQVQAELSAQGSTAKQINDLAPHKTMKGNTPSNTLVLEKLDPSSLGALLALYEHKIFVQGVMWKINSFDQWGVELGKQLGEQVLNAMAGEAVTDLSSSSQVLIARYLTSN